MSALELLAELERRGVNVRADGDELVLAPTSESALDGVDLGAVKAAKPELLAILRSPIPGLELLTTTSLYRLTSTLVVEVPGLGGPLYITPSCAEADRLRSTEPKPCAVLCVCRVLDLILSGTTKADARAGLPLFASMSLTGHAGNPGR